MAQQINEYPLMIDVQTGTLYRDFLSPIEVRPAAVKQGDTLRVVLYGVRQSIVDPKRPLEYADLPANVAIGIGELAAEPEQGVFKLTWDGDTTSNLNYNATVAEVQSALSGLASITSAGGVTVSGANGGPYRVTWTNVGNRNLITADTSAVYPPTSTSIYTSRAGTVSVSEIQAVVLERDIAAYTASFSNLDNAAVNITTIRNGATNVPEIQRVDVSTPLPYAGTFALTFDGVSTDALPYNIDSADLQIALEALGTIGANNVAVTGAFPQWDVSFIADMIGAQNVMTADASGLRVPVGKKADLDLATDGIAILVDGETSASATLEIEFPDFPQTYQFEVDVINDLIPSAPSSPTTLPTYYTEAEVDSLLALKANIASPTLTGTPAAPTASSGTNTTQIATTAFVTDAVAKQKEALQIACSDQVSDLSTGTAKVTFRMPFAMTLTAVRASVNTAPTGSTLVVDINEDTGGGPTTILSTKLSIDASEKTSTTAATPAVISDASLADDSAITIDIDQVGSTIPGKGLVVTLIGTRT
jgi:hypothetical protein